MAEVHFRPKPGRFGAQITHLDQGNPGTISPAVGASGTTTYKIATPSRKMYIDHCFYQINTLAAGGAAITGQFFLRNSVGAKSVALTGTFDLKTGSQNTVLKPAITASENQRFVQPGDYLALDIVAAGTVTTQPTDVLYGVEAYVLE